ncbi:MAG: EAL domain-containing protein [Pseudomonadota bacterium]
MPPFPRNPEPFFPGYQPLVDLVSGHIAGYEALARFRDHNGKLSSAGALFHSDELDPVSLLDIDRHIRRQALQYFARHPEAGYLTVNISPHWIARLDGDSIPTIEMIREAGIAPERIVIEITETEGKLDDIRRIVEAYRNAGMRVAIDDFGAGASQIDRIIALKPDLIKLDMKLFKNAARGGVSADVTLAATAIARRIGCEIVCEGVESEEELHFSIECGARYIQGFLFSPAREKLQATDRYLQQLRPLQTSFLGRKTDRLRTIARYNLRTQQLVERLASALCRENRHSIAADTLHSGGILRYYLCRSDGTQISDNIEVLPEGFDHRPRFRECNWSHRPYFPLLLAMRDTPERQPVVSESYRDSTNNQLCKTYGCFIGEDLVLLVDVSVPDEVLYAPALYSPLV